MKDFIVHRKETLYLVIEKSNFHSHALSLKIPLNQYSTNNKTNFLYYNAKKGLKRIDISKKIKGIKNERYIWIYTFILICSILGFSYLFVIRKSIFSKFKGSLPIEKHSFYEKIIAYEGQPLRTHQIDELFDIQKLSYDSRKLKRHRLIQEINKKHPNLIQRVKDNEDQRKYLYIINK
ncbi:MAG: hypothetical protein ACK48V_10920 [Crocinitomicaceae bacterium]